MLMIRPAQMKVFEQDAMRRFEEEMVAHSKDFSPRLCEVKAKKGSRSSPSLTLSSRSRQAGAIVWWAPNLRWLPDTPWTRGYLLTK